MRVISMVPSWTETFVEAGIEVVGRTRFCIHPERIKKTIPVVGGTKDIDWKKVNALSADLLILDKEENPKSMLDESLIPTLCSHVTDVTQMPEQLNEFAEKLNSKELKTIAERWERVLRKANLETNSNAIDLRRALGRNDQDLGIIEWIKRPGMDDEIRQVVYVIWKNPYMAVTSKTFIGSVLNLLGIPTRLSLAQSLTNYPEIEFESFDRNKTLFLFSSEPFPFHKKRDELRGHELFSAIVDGEKFSWFGLRALDFLENYFK